MLQKIVKAENFCIYLVCDVKELLKIDGITYLPDGHQWIQAPYNTSWDTDYKNLTIEKRRV